MMNYIFLIYFWSLPVNEIKVVRVKLRLGATGLIERVRFERPSQLSYTFKGCCFLIVP